MPDARGEPASYASCVRGRAILAVSCLAAFACDPADPAAIAEAVGQGGAPSSTPSPSPSPSACPSGPRRAMWSWQAADVLDPTARARQLAWASSHRVGVIYAHAPGLLDTAAHQAALAAFIGAAHAACVEVELLFGDADWALAANHGVALGMLSDAVAFASANPSARPDGVHFDVEPHTTAAWSSARVRVQSDFLDLARSLQSGASAAGLRLTLDVAFWYDEDPYRLGYRGVSARFSEHVQGLVDRVAIMDYRDTAAEIVALADRELAYAEALGKHVVLGVETNPSAEGDHVSFSEEGAAVLTQQLSTVEARFASSAAFAGTAIHDYDGYRALAP